MTIQEYIQLLGVDDDQLRNRILENTLTEEDIQNYVLAGSWTTLEQDLSLNLPFYRARYDSDNWDDKEDITQYGYIQNQQNIRQFRYNREHEQVLYTSTTPFVAFEEIKDENNQHDIYISKWRRRNEAAPFSVQLNINREGIVEESTAGRFKETMEKIADKNDDIVQAEKVGKILEADQIDGYENLNYRFSSTIASRLFQGCDALLTVSKKSDGKELNITFKREAVDTKLNIKTIYEIDAPYHHGGSILYVKRIGIPQDNRIKWHEWKINQKSLKLPSRYQNQNLTAIRQIIGNRDEHRFQFLLFPNLNKSLDNFHLGIIVERETRNRFYVEYNIDLL